MGWRAFTKELTAAVATAPAVVNTVAAASLVILLAKLLWLDDVPQLFPHADQLGKVVNDLLSATLAAYLFFVISFQVPQVIERRQAGGAIVFFGYEAAQQIILLYVNTLPNHEGSWANLTLEDVVERFRTIRPMDRSPVVANVGSAERLPWWQAMISCKDDLVATIAKLWRYSKFIDSELAGLLNDLETSAFVRMMEVIKTFSTDRQLAFGPNQTLAEYASIYFDCFRRAQALAAYCDRYKSRYGIK